VPDPIVVAGLVRRGEWTSYGDIGRAAFGGPGRARHVGLLAATDPDFPHAHRVLRVDGTIAPQWGVTLGSGPHVARGRLEREGVRFDERGHADPRRRVHWDELLRRSETVPAATPPSPSPRRRRS
jgi:alkylated DNA nucleotide flippase Atl1